MFVMYVITGLGADLEPDFGQWEIVYRVPEWILSSTIDSVWLIPGLLD